MRRRRAAASPAATSVDSTPSAGGDGARERKRDGNEAGGDEPVEARHAAEQLGRDERLHERPPDDHSGREEGALEQADRLELPDGRRQPEADERQATRWSRREYMNVMCRRGRPRWPSDERGQDRADAAAGEHEAEIARAAAELVSNPVGDEDLDRAPVREQEDGRGKQRRPQPGVRPNEREPLAELTEQRHPRLLRLPPDVPRWRMRKMAAAETRNVPASSRKAWPGPKAATIQPPRAGPTSRNANGRMNWSSEFACRRRCRGTICGTIDMKAGPKNASPVPKTAARAIRCQSSTAPVSDRTPIVAGCEHANEVGGDHDPPPLEPVGDDAADEDEQAERQRPGQRRRARAPSASPRARTPATRARRRRCRRRSSETVAPAQSRAKSLIRSGRRMPTLDRRPALECRVRGPSGSVGGVPQRAGEAAARLARFRARPRIVLQLQAEQLALELAVALEALARRGSPSARAARMAQPGSLSCAQSAKRQRAAISATSANVSLHPGACVPEAELAHARCVEHEAAPGSEDELAVRRGVAALAVAAEVPAPPGAPSRAGG